MKIVAIDPGTTHSAWVTFVDGKLRLRELCPNEELLSRLKLCNVKYEYVLVYEMIACYGMPVGAEVFETCVWIGRFIEAWGGKSEKMYRRDVKMFLCGTNLAKDANVRQALLDRFPRTGGGKTPQIGTKKQPGPLYGVKSDIWAALGVAVTYHQMQEQQNG